jgi:hypothetical protein
VCTWSAFSAAACPTGYYLAYASSLGWNGSVTTAHGWGVVDVTTAAREGRAAGDEERARAPLPSSPQRRALLTVIYDDQARRCRRRTVPERAVEVRRARRVVRRVGVLSLARCAALFYLCAVAIFMTAALGLWQLASRSGAIPGIESFIGRLFAMRAFRPRPSRLLAATLATGMATVIIATAVTVLVGVVFNLISDVVGGIDVMVLEEVPVEQSATPTIGYLGLRGFRSDGAGPARSSSSSRGAYGEEERVWRSRDGS